MELLLFSNLNLMKKGRAKSGRIVAQAAEVYKRERHRGESTEQTEITEQTEKTEDFLVFPSVPLFPFVPYSLFALTPR
jgi:hypothetical protein